ncbi:MAG: hypothetical protein ACRD13_10280 [Terriglobales bacterium]
MSFSLGNFLSDIEKVAEEIPGLVEKVLGIGTVVANDVETVAEDLVTAIGAASVAVAAGGTNISLDVAAWNDIAALAAQLKAILAGQPATPAPTTNAG